MEIWPAKRTGTSRAAVYRLPIRDGNTREPKAPSPHVLVYRLPIRDGNIVAGIPFWLGVIRL